jgi:hypothetical protein
MKITGYSAAAVVLLCICLLSGIGATAYAQDASEVRTTQVDGAVTKNGSPLKEGEIIQRDDRIEAKADSAAVLTWSNGSIVRIYPETVIVLSGVMYESDRKLEKSLLRLEKGRIFVKAQVPEHLFSHFEIIAGGMPIITQGAEFALKYEDSGKNVTVWSILGTVIADTGIQRSRVEEGLQAVLKYGVKPENPVTMPDKIKDALIKTSKELGGSLLIDEEKISVGGPLKVKIGGVKNRRGDAPYKVKFKAIINGGSGRIKSVKWSFGDGESAEGKEVEHTFTQGVYIVVIKVEDENGEKASSQISVSVEEQCTC